ncbi:MAG: ribonuclease toxin HepT-like protein [Bacillota bacterium]
MDESMPETPDWHLELLQQMATEVPGLRPALIADETKNRLNEFRSFRHVFRNVYGFNLIPQRIERLLESLPSTIELLKSDLERFFTEMRDYLKLVLYQSRGWAEKESPPSSPFTSSSPRA